MTIARVTCLDGLESLAEEACKEGFNFLERLVQEWNDGTNRFDAPGQVLFAACDGDTIVGTAGLTRQGPALGRVRRVYVHPERRKQGIAAALMAEVLGFARELLPGRCSLCREAGGVSPA